VSSLLFLFQLSGFILLVHWAYINDQARPSDAAIGFLQMRGASAENPVERHKAAPGWRRAAARARNAARPAKPARSAPAWRRPLR
jgi:hypothetical protein